ncbi:MAG: M18 family aminopeptidase [Campylobacterota bacterium]|nr:M18 family aminopeptidase [Campylobacterota bacterium]
MNKKRFNNQLLQFLDNSPTPYHALEQMKKSLHVKGFKELHESENWMLQKGEKYFVTRNDSSIIAFTYPKERKKYLMMGAHTDSPNLKIKPNPLIKKEGLIQLAVEPYGGVLINPWFDRDLSIAGKVIVSDEKNNLHEHLIDFKDPIAIISSLAIHLDKTANKERSVNMQNDIAPILTSRADFDFEQMILKELRLPASKLISYDLSFYDTQKASFVGIEKEFIACARLDNLLSCFVNLQTLLHVKRDDAVLMVCSDHEEVGSESTTGAAGPFLEQVLRRIESSEESYIQMLRESLLVSCDNAHAAHPNFADKHEPNHKPQMNQGVVIKINSNQRYASNVLSMSRFIQASADIKIQKYVTRSDMGCGSTIGPITATRLGIETIDVGLPTLAMHSIRELAGSDDAHELYEILMRLSRG